jgi:SAM-dependent methyltransferase
MRGPASTAEKNAASHGMDTSSQWMDELDLETLRFAVSPKVPRRVAVDLGCGLGTQGIRLAVLGFESVLYDSVDIGERIERVRQALSLPKLTFRQVDLRHATPDDFPPDIGVVYTQRFIHYLRFEEAAALIATLASRMCAAGRLFISASGLGSELGTGYAHAGHPLEQRFAPLAVAMQVKHAVREPVCLYALPELERLVTAQGFGAVRTWASPFGNVKGVFERL